MVLVRKSKYYC